MVEDRERDYERQRGRQRRFLEDIENFVDEAVTVATEGIRDTMSRARLARDSVVMVRVNKESLERMDELVDAGIANSRSEAAAFLIMEGIKARQPLFDKIHSKTEEIRRAKEELRRLVVDEEGESPSSNGEGRRDIE